MTGSWRIARVAGIDLSIHWTFGLLLGWVLWSSSNGHGLFQGLLELVFVLALFGCVVLHELGHAMAARVFGIPTHGITLLPIGGVAQLDRIPRDPWQEWVIALAGPAVNVLIVGLLFPLTAILHGASGWSSPLAIGGSLLARLMWVNVMLVAFNLLPAFPMDGGRIFRSWLALRTNYVTATRRAKRLGQAVAVLLAICGLWSNPLLILIAAFVFLAAESEYRTVLRESAEQGAESGERRAESWAGIESSAVASPPPVASGQLKPAPHSVTPLVACHQILPNGVVIVRTLPIQPVR